MRSILITVLTGGIIFLVISCATAPTGSLAPGELRLLKMDAPWGGTVKRGISFAVNIHFESEGRPEIRTACTYWSGDGPYCSKVKKVDYEAPGTIQIELLNNSPGSYTLESYVLYIRDGKPQSTNVVNTQIYIVP